VNLVEAADPISGSVRVFAGFDDNVPYVEDVNPFWAGETESAFIGFDTTVAYTRKVAADLLLIPSLNLGYTYYFKE